MERKTITLTEAEAEAINLVAKGLSTQEAADALAIKKKAMDARLMTAYQKIKALTGDEVMNRVKAFRALKGMDVVVGDGRLRKSTD